MRVLRLASLMSALEPTTRRSAGALRRLAGGDGADAPAKLAAALNDENWRVQEIEACKDASGKGPLHFAAWRGAPKNCEILIDAGCDVEAPATGEFSYGKTPLFFDKKGPWTLSSLGQQWSAGQLKYAKEFTWFLAPYINSYKRFQSGTFAPTKIMWSEDNRTAGFRLCGEGTKGIRMECRIGGADLNPYLAFAALIAAGLAGIDEKLELQKPFVGDAYQASRLPEIPKTLREATETMAKSKMLKAAFGEDVIDHYVHTARWEQFEYDRRITDWELHRGFERY